MKNLMMKTLMKRMILSALILASVALAASDSAKFMGPTGDGHYPQIDTLGKQLWTKTIGCGYSNVAVVGGRLYTAGHVQAKAPQPEVGTKAQFQTRPRRRPSRASEVAGEDVIYCLDAATGKEIWTYTYPALAGKFKGPRATPTIADGKLYFVSRAAETFCLDAKTGEKIWSTPAKKVRAKSPTFGNSTSVLLHEGLCIVNLGRVVAFDAKTGKVKWMSRVEYTKAYNTPRTITVGGKTMLVVTCYEGIVTMDPKSGKTLDLFPWKPPGIGTTITMPILVGKDQLFISASYKIGCGMLTVSPAGKMKLLWKNMDLLNHVANSMLFAKEGYLVGFHGNTGATNPLVAMDVKTGKVLWEKKDVGSGGVIKCGRNLLLIGYGGKVELLTPSRTGVTVLQSMQVFTSTPCWTAPAVAGSKAYFRDNPKGGTKSTLTCYAVK